MQDSITITGLVATTPRHILTNDGLSITSFRLASAQRRFDRAQERWIDVDTNWYTITSFRQLALNCATSIQKGQRVVVTGRLRIREWDNGERTGTNVDIEAEAVGHDLAWGTTTFSRSIVSSAAPTPGDPGADRAETGSEPGSTPESTPESTPASADEQSATGELRAPEDSSELVSARIPESAVPF